MATLTTPKIPTYGKDATGQNAYAQIIASPRGSGTYENKMYTNMLVWCATNDAIVSIDGGASDDIYVSAGKEPMRLDGLTITKSVQAKNATGGSNYANLVVIVW